MKNSFISAFFRYNRWPLSKNYYSICHNSRDLVDAQEIIKLYCKQSNIEIVNIDESFDFIERELEYCLKKNWKVIDPTSIDYPQSLFLQEYPPIFLTVMGNSSYLSNDFISVVGGREPSYDAMEWMNYEFFEFIKRSGFGVVSGGARGIDILAHKVAIRNNCPTIALMPSGLKNIYPPDFIDLVSSVIDCGGCLISEYLPSEEIKKYHFHERNRLISSLGHVLLVVQARLKSGSLLTARYALESGKDVIVVPWGPRDPKAMGTNKLLVEGASVVRDSEDLITFFRYRGYIFKDIEKLIPNTFH